MERIKKTNDGQDFELETIVRKETHKRSKSKNECQSRPTTRCSRNNRSEKSGCNSKSGLFMQIFASTEKKALMDDSDQKKRKSKNHYSRKKDIYVRMDWPIVSIHNSDIRKSPPYIKSNCN